ncbi:MAG: hypothetical protein CL940_12820 [Deltaproteobacteria bacterium]|nr:hypothetical protein [Deltaproteobacteria bacterium]
MIRTPALRLAVLLLLAAWAPGASATAVIEPSQNLEVRRAVGPAGSSLTGGWTVDRWELAGERIDVHLEGETGSVTVALRGERGEGGTDSDWIQTRQGWIRSAPGLSSGVLQALKEHLERPGAQIVWRVHKTPGDSADEDTGDVDQDKAQAERDQLTARLSARLSGAPLTEERLAPEVSTALQLLLGGDEREVRRRLARPSDEVPELPDGAYSVWLAAGHVPEQSLPDLLQQLPHEPRLLSMMAARAYEEGRYDAAGWWLDAALKTPLADGEVLQLAERFGWTDHADRDGALPASNAGSSSVLSGWTVCGGLAWLLLLVVAVRRRRPGLGFALALGLAVAWVVIPPRAAVERPALPQELVLPLAGGECASSPTRFDGDALLAHLSCPEGRGTIQVRPRAVSDDAFMVTEHHAVSMALQSDDLRVLEPRLERAARRLTAALRSAEGGGFRLADQPWTETPPLREGWPEWRARTDSERAQHRVVAGLVAAAWVLLLLTLYQMGRDALSGWASHPRTRRWLLGALLFAVVAHALAPARMVMVFGGYDLVSHLVDGLIPRYGAGALWTYGPWMWTFGHDHAVLQTANRILGLILVLVSWDLGRRLYPSRPRALAIAAWAMALAPVLWRAHSSESIVVGPALFVLLAMRALTLGKEARVGEAAIWGAAAATARPEIALVVCAIPVWSWLAGLRWRREALSTFAALLAGLLLIGIHLVTVISTARDLSASGALPALDNPVVVALGSILWVGVFANITFTPIGLTPLLAAGVVGSLKTKRALTTLAVAILWVLLTSVDLVEVSVPRLHVPALLLALPLLGMGWEWLEARVGRGRGGRSKLALAGLVLLVGSVYNGHEMFKPTNEDVEERLWRETLDRLPDDARCLATMGYGDPPPAEKTPRHNPLYLLRANHAHIAVTNLVGISEAESCDGGHYALLGMRCYADLREDGRPQPQGEAPLPICGEVLKEYVVEPVFERRVTNYGDLAFELYPTGESLRVGLYRVTSKKTAN